MEAKIYLQKPRILSPECPCLTKVQVGEDVLDHHRICYRKKQREDKGERQFMLQLISSHKARPIPANRILLCIVFYVKHSSHNTAVSKGREIKIFICILPLSNLTPLQEKHTPMAVVLSYSMDSLEACHFKRYTNVQSTYWAASP